MDLKGHCCGGMSQKGSFSYMLLGRGAAAYISIFSLFNPVEIHDKLLPFYLKKNEMQRK